jgi:hypothetical protein
MAKQQKLKQPSTYNVVWIVNGIIKEHLAYNKPRAIANWIKRKAEVSTHKSGKVILINNNI